MNRPPPLAALLLILTACPSLDSSGESDSALDSVPDSADSGVHDSAKHTVLVAPYLQSFTPTSGWVCWETADGEESYVEYGTTDALGSRASGTVVKGGHGSQHEVQLLGLTPDTTYWYVATTGATRSAPAHFRTQPTSGKPFRLVAVSDMQRDDAQPKKWAEIVESGVVPYITAQYGADLPAALGLVLLPGDLVDSGWQYTDWTDDFFAGAASLSASVPIYPVPGNHEGGSPAFFQYFHLPDNGTAGFEEHWWTTDYENLRVIGLDSTAKATLTEQLAWLDGVLAQTCHDDTIEFVFAELHHPFLSELWVDGEMSWTGDVVGRMEAFTAKCGKPSAHLFGHSHGYSRGQSMEHTHLWVDVATAGGAIDRWGSTNQADYSEFSNTQAEYGFVVVEVEPGAFTLRRISMGTPEAPKANEVTDEITVHLNPVPPTTPTPVSPVATAPVTGALTLVGSPFQHPEGGLHGASRWQVSADCVGFSDPVFDRWVQYENWYGGVDTQAGVSLERVDVGKLPAGAWCWRVRYRDRGLAWSEWSSAGAFSAASTFAPALPGGR